MKRTWIGAVILTALLVTGLLSARWMERHHAPLETLLRQAAEAALEDRWDQARSRFERAQEGWQEKRNLTAAFSDHSPMEEIDSQFAEGTVYAAAGEQVHFAALCLSLAEKMEAMGDAHSLSWWNIL